MYRDQWGGMDSLDRQYKDAVAQAQPIPSESWKTRSSSSWRLRLSAGASTIGVIFTNDFYDEETDEGGEIYLDRYDLLDSSGRVLSSHEFEDLETPHNKERDYQCGAPRRNPETGREDYVELWSGGSGCAFVFDVVVPRDDVYEIAVVAWSEPDELYRPDGRAKLAVVENPYRWGETLGTATCASQVSTEGPSQMPTQASCGCQIGWCVMIDSPKLPSDSGGRRSWARSWRSRPRTRRTPTLKEGCWSPTRSPPRFRSWPEVSAAGSAGGHPTT